MAEIFGRKMIENVMHCMHVIFYFNDMFCILFYVCVCVSLKIKFSFIVHFFWIFFFGVGVSSNANMWHRCKMMRCEYRFEINISNFHVGNLLCYGSTMRSCRTTDLVKSKKKCLCNQCSGVHGSRFEIRYSKTKLPVSKFEDLLSVFEFRISKFEFSRFKYRISRFEMQFSRCSSSKYKIQMLNSKFDVQFQCSRFEVNFRYSRFISRCSLFVAQDSRIDIWNLVSQIQFDVQNLIKA